MYKCNQMDSLHPDVLSTAGYLLRATANEDMWKNIYQYFHSLPTQHLPLVKTWKVRTFSERRHTTNKQDGKQSYSDVARYSEKKLKSTKDKPVCFILS